VTLPSVQNAKGRFLYFCMKLSNKFWGKAEVVVIVCWCGRGFGIIEGEEIEEQSSMQITCKNELPSSMK